MNFKNILAKQPLFIFLLIPIVSTVLHWRIFTTDLVGIHLWRQSQTQINIQNFYRHDFNIMNPRNNSFNGGKDNIMRYEFPIMQWLIAAAHKTFGESIVITRISMFLFGLLGVLGAFYLIKELWNDNLLALLGAWAFNFSPLFYYYTMNPLPDVFALCSTIWAMAFFFRYLKTEQKKDIILAALFLSVATLAKLPYIIFGAMVGIHLLQQLFKKGISTLKESIFVAITVIIFLLPAFFWYKWVIPTWGNNGVLKGIFDNQVPLSKTLAIFRFHAFSLLPKLLLNYAAVPFFGIGLFFMFKNRTFKQPNWTILAAIGLSVIVYFLFEFNMIDVIHDYYMMPFLPPLLIIVAYGIKQLLHLNKLTQALTVGLMIALPLLAFRTVDNYWRVEKSYFNNDLIKNKEDLRKIVPNNEHCIMLNDHTNFIFSYQIDKQGYIFTEDYLPPEWIEDMIKRYNVHYMYSDSRKVDESPKVLPFIDSLILERGSVRVFKLKKL
jgi:4-amino-4-deoxy-L-arabinose transferase-like glycosyltransferase